MLLAPVDRAAALRPAALAQPDRCLLRAAVGAAAQLRLPPPDRPPAEWIACLAPLGALGPVVSDRRRPDRLGTAPAATGRGIGDAS